MTRPNNPPTPAEQAMSCLYETQNGGWAVRSGSFDEFDAIPCVHDDDEVLVILEEDRYTYDGGEGYDLVLSLAWGDDEFFIVPSPDRAAVVVVEDEEAAAAAYEANFVAWLSGGLPDWDGES